MPKRKASAVAAVAPAALGATDSVHLVNGLSTDGLPTNGAMTTAPAADAVPHPSAKRRRTQNSVPAIADAELNPDTSKDVLDGPVAQRGSPDQDLTPAPKAAKKRETKTPKPKASADADNIKREATPPVQRSKAAPKSKATPKKDVKKESTPEPTLTPTPANTTPSSAKSQATNDAHPNDPEAEGDDAPADPEEIKAALHRPPPVHSSMLPLPWKGRLGYACLNTYLRNSNPPVFCSRTTRIASILEHRHPLADLSAPEHPTKNRPDRSKPADVALGQKFVENLCLANVADISKMIRWNERYGIRFMRLSSEMFPFASHPEYGYTLDFAGLALAEAGKVIAELGHRVTTHPGQFTQLGSPRKPVIDNAIRDLAYHDQMLSLLALPEQANKDAVMILHMGGAFGSKPETLDRFRENYARLPQSVKNRLVLENDDVTWSVHDLLPVCEELNIPFVLDFHHHNIIFDAAQIREGTHDIISLYPRILATWLRKGITPKMHYSEPTAPAITGKQRRKHSARVMTLPPCPDTMDLMIEAKDKEQAVFELMRTFKLPGWDTFNDVIPYVRSDDNKILEQVEKKAQTKKAKAAAAAAAEAGESTEHLQGPARISEEDRGMGGADGRVYWPPGMEEWLRPQKRIVKPKADTAVGKKTKKTTKDKTEAADTAREEAEGLAEDINDDNDDDDIGPESPVARRNGKGKVTGDTSTSVNGRGKKGPVAQKHKGASSRKAKVKKEATPDDVEESEDDAAMLDAELDDLSSGAEDDESEEVEQEDARPAKRARGRPAAPARKASGRAARGGKKNYADGADEEDDE